MGLFDRFKRKPTVMDRTRELLNMDISEIWALTDRDEFLTAMEGHVSRRCNHGKAPDDLREAERVFYVVRLFEAEVMNGGVEQFLSNTSPELAALAPDALRAVGAKTTASLARSARAPGADTDACNAQLYAYPDDLAELCYRYIMENREEFSGK